MDETEILFQFCLKYPEWGDSFLDCEYDGVDIYRITYNDFTIGYYDTIGKVAVKIREPSDILDRG